MKITVAHGDIIRIQADLAIVNLFEGVKKPGGATGAVDAKLGGMIADIVSREHFMGAEGALRVIDTHGKIPARQVLLAGLGAQNAFSLESIRRVTAASLRKAREVGAHTVATIVHGAGIGGFDPAQSSSAMAEGLYLGAYRFLAYQREEQKRHAQREVSEITIVEYDKGKIGKMKEGVRYGETVAKGTNFVRDLVNAPPAHSSPKYLADTARHLAARSGISGKVFRYRDIKKMGMGAFLGIARGSDEEPYFIHLTYKPKPKKKAHKRLAVVGKGITFDSGGLSLKPPKFMETMKIDMAGAAAMLGLFSILPELAPSIEVHGIAAVCENMPSGKAIKPGDVVRVMNGKTIEILDTDAEGRVTLADSLSYAIKLKPDYIIDVATLTGACLVALGEEVAGVMGNNDSLTRTLLNAAEKSGERFWQLPLVKEYKEYIKSDVAHLRNIPKIRYGDSISAGLFLQEFVGETPWLHLDIAGPAWAERDSVPYMPRGATGFGVRTLARLLELLSH